MTQEKILVVEDDESIREFLDLFLKSYGYSPIHACDGYEGLLTFEKDNPALVLMDMMMPNFDGISATKEIRKVSNVPIIFISCKKDSSDIIEGLEAGGDDYVTKPFHIDELIARIRSNLRRAPIFNRSRTETPFTSNKEANYLFFDELKIDPTMQKAYCNGLEVSLSAIEYRLLLFLAQHQNKIFNTKELYTQIWGSDSLGDTRTVSVHISNLRKKIEKDPTNPKFILTIRGVGFMFSGKSNHEF